ncbi:MAG: hypothetical protein M1834_000997 [Cirrosporium novae-zelandiae]|nr:MAG: hypothetical protein M1834_000997 [Cirrosporium novae-zelandiae]
MPDFSQLTSPAPYHIISYGTLLGTTVFQSFVGGTVAFQRLARPQFSHLQQGIFPIYFGMQTALPVLIALTYPVRRGLGITAVFAPQNRISVLAPLACMLVTGATNLLVVGPATTKCMKERKRQESKDGKKSYDSGSQSQKMVKLNKQFSRLHGLSSLVNVGGIIAMVWYGFTLAERIR